LSLVFYMFSVLTVTVTVPLCFPPLCGLCVPISGPSVSSSKL